MTKQNTTDITILLDRSGSMGSIASDMCGACNSFFEKQKEVSGECKVTLIQFDSRKKAFFEGLKPLQENLDWYEDLDWYQVVYQAIDIKNVPPLSLEPRLLTALLDALGKAIKETGERLSLIPESDRPSQVLFVIITDGEENASVVFNKNQIFDMIKHQQDVYSWEFIFLGANQDAIAVAGELGIQKNAVTYQANAGGLEALSRGLTSGVTRYRTSGKARMDDIVDQKNYDQSIKK